MLNAWLDESQPGIKISGRNINSLRYANDTTVIAESEGGGKTRDLFKKMRDMKGTFHAKMGSIKDRNGMDLTEA